MDKHSYLIRDNSELVCPTSQYLTVAVLALVYAPGAHVVLHYLEGGKLRVVGSMTVQ